MPDCLAVVTGMGVVTPLGLAPGELLERWAGGECAIHDGRARCTDFDAAEHLSAKEIRRTERFTQLALAASRGAIEGSGVLERVDPDAIGCVVGTCFGGLPGHEREIDVHREGGSQRVSPLAIHRSMSNAPSAAIAIRYGVHGPARGVATACAAGTDAIGVATRMIQCGDADAVLAGGTEASITDYTLEMGATAGAYSRSGICRPFDERRDGLVMGEGAAVLVLESPAAAARSGAPVLAEVLGFGATTDAFHLSAPEPDGTAAARAMTRALADAGLTGDDLDYVNAHGTSTVLNDRAETAAIKRALGKAAYDVPISSTKSVIGHLIGAAGAVELVAAIEALRAGVAPPTVGHETPEDGLDLNYVAGAAQRLGRTRSSGGGRRLVAMSNSLGFGGHNAVMCVAASTRSPAAVS